MKKKRKLLMAFVSAVVLMALFVVAAMIITLLDCLPKPWNYIANGAMFLAFATYGIYGLISEFKDSTK